MNRDFGAHYTVPGWAKHLYSIIIALLLSHLLGK